MNFDQHLSQRARNMVPIAIRTIVRRSSGPEFITFTAGRPAPNLFPIEAIREKTDKVLSEQGSLALQYGGSDGVFGLRTWIAQHMGNRTPDDILVVSGSQQVVDLVGKVFVDPGDKVIVAEPTYMGALSSLNVVQPQFLGVPCDDEGMMVAPLEAALKQGGKLIYVIPNFNNPDGIDMSQSRREAVASLAQDYNALILEDDPYGALRFDREAPSALHELAPERVIYAGSFSKILSPGIRLGWLSAPEEVMPLLLMAKQAADLQTSTFTQMIVAELVQDGFMNEQIKRTRAYYKQQRDHILAATDRYFPSAVRYETPNGGMFLWCELPNHLNATAVLEDALAEKVAYIPGEFFYPNGGGQNTMRLSFSVVTKSEIDKGIEKLGRVFGRAIETARE
ncbi:MAG: PLP-dependent aminotransferase family protein [Chloroflexota bacterium]